MSKLDNIIFLEICSISHEYYKKTNFLTYPEYCVGMGKSIKVGSLNRREKVDILTIISGLDKIFGLTTEENGMYINKYFNLKPSQYIDFQDVVITTKKLFPEITKIENLKGR